MLRLRHHASDSPLYEGKPSTKVSLTNLSFDLSEEELFDYLKDYGAIWTILPVHSVYGFRKNHPQPLGIAYAEFETVEKAQTAIDALFNQLYKGRPMKLRFHQPYVPRQKQRWRRKESSPTNSEIALETEEGPVEHQGQYEGQESQESLEIPNIHESQRPPDSQEPLEQQEPLESRAVTIIESPPDGPPPAYRFRRQNKKNKQLSMETVYCKIIPEGTTDAHLRQFFKAYRPREIWIFKSRPVKKGCFGKPGTTFTSALITLSTNLPLKNVTKSMSKKKLLNSKVEIIPAPLSKIEEVRKVAQLERSVQVVPEDTQSIGSPQGNTLDGAQQESDSPDPVAESRERLPGIQKATPVHDPGH